MPFIANPVKTYVGTVRENSAAPSAAATQCPVIRAPKYILQTETDAWILTDEQLAAKFAGKKVVVTAGPTAEPIDPVRVLTNRSSGKQGYAIAGALAELGAEVTLVSGPTALSAPVGVKRVWVETAVDTGKVDMDGELARLLQSE